MKMKKTTITRRGIGTGVGDEVKVLSQDVIEKIISNLDWLQVYKIAYEAVVKNFENGYAILDTQDGKVSELSLQDHETLQAVDGGTLIYLLKWGKNEDIDPNGEIAKAVENGADEEEEIKEVLYRLAGDDLDVNIENALVSVKDLYS